jgi:hypothetical protein
MLLGLQPTAELSTWPDHRPRRDELLQPVAESVSPANPEESQQVGEQEGLAPGQEVIKLFGDVIKKNLSFWVLNEADTFTEPNVIKLFCP